MCLTVSPANMYDLSCDLSLKSHNSGVRQVWCLGSGVEQENQINRTVDGAVLSILLTGLLPEVHYSVVVAAVTSLGVGAQSPPVSLLLCESLKLLQLLHMQKYAKMHFPS